MALFKSITSSIRRGLRATRDSFTAPLRSLLSGRVVDDALLSELEATLVRADVGVQCALRLVDGVREAHREGRLSKGEDVIEHLKTELKQIWPPEDRSLSFSETSSPTVILVAGVNGAGKTTSIAKIAHALQADGRSVLLAACDTYRAGAVRQLEIWSERLGIQIVKGAQGGDPAAVAFDACEAAIARGVDVLVLDTAGRLHTQDPLMRQLTKIRDVVARKIEGAPHEVLLVLDATTGQNAIAQARQFKEAIDVSGLFLSKLDGTAKGGIVIAIHEDVGIPVKFIGVGETPEDVQPFDPDEFVEALFEAPPE